MSLEDLTGTKYINSLVSTNPSFLDSKSEGDDHIRGIKNVLKLSFPNISGAVTSTHTELNKLDGVTATATEINYLDITTLGTGAASKAVVLNAGEDYTWPATGILTYGVLKDSLGTTLTATAAELNALDGITATVSELNILDGVTATAAEINLLDGVTGPLKGAFRGALVYKSAPQSISNNTITAITFDSESYDSSGIHDTVTNNSRLTVPSGYSKVRLLARIDFDSGSTTAATRTAFISKNGGTFVGQPNINLLDQFFSATIESAVVNVTAGDYFVLGVTQSSGGSIDVGTDTWFAMELIE